MKRLGIDFGASVMDVALEDDGEIVQTWYFPSGTFACSDAGLKLLLVELNLGRLDEVVATGGRSAFLADAVAATPLRKIGEITAIASGIRKLANYAKPMLGVCMGTGTAMIYDDGKQSTFLGGSAVGGGTLLGLGKLLLGTEDYDKIAALARLGHADQIDLTIADIVGSSIGKLAGDVVASHFGKVLKKADNARADIAAGLIHLIAETVALIAMGQARQFGLDEAMVVGRLSENKQMQTMIMRSGRDHDFRFVLIAQASLATVIGALADRHSNGD